MENIVICMSNLIFYLLLFLIYLLYQGKRNDAVYKIRMSWVNNQDKRRYKYSYDYMFMPKLKNYFGLQYPKDKHFK